MGILQSCRAIDGCYWTKIAKKNENVYKEKEVKKSQNLELFQEKDLNFAISKFSKFFKKYFFYNIEALLEVSLGKKKIEAKNRVKLRIFSEARRQDFSSDHIAFQNRSKNYECLKIMTSI